MNARRASVLACLLALAAAPPAGAAILPGQAVDGPDSDILATQSVQVDVAPDGTAALAYLKTDGGEDHVFVSRFAGGAWGAPFQADAGSDTAASALRLAVANGGKIVVTFKLATGAVVSRIKPNAAAPFGADQFVLANGEYANVDLAANGNGYAVGQANNDVFARRLEGTTWSDVNSGNPLNNDAAEQAGGAGMNEIRVATVPSGASGVAAWGEDVSGGSHDVFARRLTGTAVGPAAGAHLTSFPGGDVGAAPVADQPDVGIDAAGTGWVVFRQDIKYGAATRHRAIARPFTGDAFGPHQVVDGAPEPPTEGRDFTRVDVNAAGQGLVAHYGNLSNDSELARLAAGSWTRGTVVNLADNQSVPFVIPAIGENGSGIVSWIHGPPGSTIILARTTLGGLGPILTLSNAAFGTTVGGGPQAAAGPGAFAAVAFVQQEGAANRRVVAAVVDLPVPLTPGDGGGDNGDDEDAPEITDVRMRRRFRRGGDLAEATAVRTGTNIRFTLSEAATVRLSFAQALPGRRVNGRCVKPRRSNRGRRRCVRFRRVRPALRFEDLAAGRRRIHFEGRLRPKKALRPGRHRLTLRATDAAGNRSEAVRKRFRLLKRKKRG